MMIMNDCTGITADLCEAQRRIIFRAKHDSDESRNPFSLAKPEMYFS